MRRMRLKACSGGMDVRTYEVMLHRERKGEVRNQAPGESSSLAHAKVFEILHHADDLHIRHGARLDSRIRCGGRGGCDCRNSTSPSSG